MSDSNEPAWEFVTDCETAGPLMDAIKAAGKEDELPLRAHPYAPVGYVFAFNRKTLTFSEPLPFSFHQNSAE